MEKLIQQFLVREQKPSGSRFPVAFASLIMMIAVFSFACTLKLDAPLAALYWLNDNNYWLLVILFSFILMFICAITPLPAEAVTIANGMIFGPVAGTLVTWCSAMLGAGVSFLYGRHLLKKNDLAIIENKQYVKISEWFDRYGYLGFTAARLIPVVPFFALNIGAAFLPLSTRNYFLITGICILPHIMLICFFSGQITGH